MQSDRKRPVFESDIAHLFEAYLSEKTMQGYKYIGVDTYLKSFDTFLKDKDCKSELSKEIMMEWVKPKPHLKASTIEHNICMLQGLCDFLNRNDFKAYRIPSELIPQRTHDFEAYVFSYNEIERILAVVDGFKYVKSSPKRHIVYPMLFRVLCFCGLRISEALKLKVKDVNLKQSYLVLTDTKDYRDRIIPFDKTMLEKLSTYKAQLMFMSEEDYFFPSPDGSRYSISTIEATFRNILFDAGIPYCGKGKGPRLHDLRHTFCVHSLQKLIFEGKNPYAALPLLMMYVGHRSVSATSKYIHLSAESYPDILKKTEERFGYLIPSKEDSNA